ncbi:MAG: pyridoxal-phosphate dependent enzyme, partial [Spirochaetales bacterium]
MVEQSSLYHYQCCLCGKEYSPVPNLLLCPVCEAIQRKDEPPKGVLEVSWNYEALKKHLRLSRGKWEIWDLLPLEKEFFPPIPVGNTPLWKPIRLWQELQVSGLYLKDDGANPTGSLKDRASYLVAGVAKKYGFSTIAVASTGNAASSMAGVGAAAGIQIKIFMPKTAPKAKQVQALLYGAEVTLVEGTYDDAFDTSVEYCKKHTEVLSRNTAQQPLTIEGKKTVALEIVQQLGQAPERVYLSVGDGVILAGVYRGFEDLFHLGLITAVPTLVGVQAEGSDAIARAVKKGSFENPVRANTIADSIAVEIPRNGHLAVKKINQYRGRMVVVS